MRFRTVDSGRDSVAVSRASRLSATVRHPERLLLLLNSIPTVLGTRNEEPEKPYQEQDHSNDPKHVQCETGAGEDQYEKQHQQDQAHSMSPLRSNCCGRLQAAPSLFRSDPMMTSPMSR